MSLTLKLTSLGIRTVSKPIGNLIKRQAREHEGFRQFCVRFAQGLHRIDARMRLGLLEDSEAIARQIEKEAASAEAKRLRSSTNRAPTVKTQEQTAVDEQTKAKERRFIEEKVKNDEKKRERQMLKPLSESKAIETGANFASEAFVFMIGVGLLLFENRRSKRKESSRREDVAERLEQLEDDVQRAHDEKTLLEEHVGSLVAEIDRLKATSPAAPGSTNGNGNANSSTPPPPPSPAKPQQPKDSADTHKEALQPQQQQQMSKPTSSSSSSTPNKAENHQSGSQSKTG